MKLNVALHHLEPLRPGLGRRLLGLGNGWGVREGTQQLNEGKSQWTVAKAMTTTERIRSPEPRACKRGWRT